jgi:fructokinase
VQVDARRATGRVGVATADGEPRFTIEDDQAYDNIEPAALPDLAAERFAFLYHGTLAARHATSAATLRALRALRLPTFVDVNLRAPWWERSAVEDLLAGARWLKLNAAELAELDGTAGTLLQRADRLRKRFGLETVVVTSGAQGSLTVTADLSYQERPDRIPNFVDSVGAGDAFSAVLLLGLAHSWTPPFALRCATAFAAAICGVRGALPPDDSIYQRFSRQWRT